MIFSETKVAGRPEFLGSAKFMAIQHEFTESISAGREIEITDSLGNTHYGITLNDVDVDINPNGAVVVLGIIKVSKLPAALSASAKAAMYPTLIFVE